MRGPFLGCCQTNANQCQFGRGRGLSGRAELTPLGKGCGAIDFEGVPAGEAAFLVEVIVDGRMDGGEGLQTSHSSEPEHRSLSSSQWQMRVLGAIVQPSPRRLQIRPGMTSP